MWISRPNTDIVIFTGVLIKMSNMEFDFCPVFLLCRCNSEYLQVTSLSSFCTLWRWFNKYLLSGISHSFWFIYWHIQGDERTPWGNQFSPVGRLLVLDGDCLWTQFRELGLQVWSNPLVSCSQELKFTGSRNCFEQ